MNLRNIFKFIIDSFRIIISLVFLFASIPKINSPQDFYQSILNYKVISGIPAFFFAITIPWIELISSVLLLFSFWIKENLIILNFLLIVFTILIIRALLIGLDIECGCFGSNYSQNVGIPKILENIALILFGLIIYFYENNIKK